MEGGGTRTLPAGGLIAFAGLAQNRHIRFVLHKLGFKVDCLHEVQAAITDGHKAFRKRSGNGIFRIHYRIHTDLHPFLTAHRQSCKAVP